MPGGTEGILVGSARVSVLPDMSGFVVEAASKIKADLAGLNPRVKLGVDIDPASVAKARAALGPLAGDTKIPVGFTVDKTSLAAAAASTRTLTAETQRSAVAAGTAYRGYYGLFGLLRRPLPLFAGAATIGGLHLLVDSIAEAAAVLIPASVALAAFGAAAVGPVQDLYTHFKNVNIVAQALGRNLGPLSGGFSQLSDAVRPQVYSLLGDALQVINSRTGELSKLATGAGQVFDQLGARVALALKSSGFSQFLANAVPDLQKLGNVAGNVFGVIGNLLKTMPGYAERLLTALQGVTHGLEVITGSSIVQGLLHAGLSLHGLWLYGGLAATAIGGLIPRTARLVSALGGVEKGATALGTLSKDAGFFARMRAGVSDLGPGIAGIGTRLLAFASNPVAVAITAVGALAVGVGVLAYHFLHAKDATAQWVAGLQNAVNMQPTFTGVIRTTQLNLEKINAALAGAKSAYRDAMTGANSFGASQFQLSQNAARYAHQIGDLTAGQRQQSAEQKLAISRSDQLRLKFGSLSTAQGIWNKLGLKSADIGKVSAAVWANDIQQLTAYETGLKAVAYASGVAGTNEKVLDYLIGDQYTNLQQLNSAWDTYTKLQASGDTALLSVASTLAQLGKDAGKAGASFTSLNAPSLKLRTDFSHLQVYVQQVIDALRYTPIPLRELAKVVATEYSPAVKQGALSNDSYRTSIFLAAKEAGYAGLDKIGPLTKFINANRVSARLAGNMIDEYAGKINLGAKAAGNLSSILLSQLNVQLSQTELKASGAVDEAAKYSQMLRNNTADTKAGQQVRVRLIRDLENAGLSAKQATAYVNGLAKAEGRLHSKTIKITEYGSGSYTVSEAGHVVAHGVGPNIAPAGHAIHIGGNAAGSFVGVGTTPTADDVFARVSKGELIVPTKMVSAGLVDHLRGMIPGFQAGGVAGVNLPAMTKTFDQTMTDVMTTAMVRAMTVAAQSAASAFAGGGLGRAGLRGLENLWIGAGGPGGGIAHIAAAIALAESGGVPSARNPSGASGLWQILGLPFPGNPFNPQVNARMAVAKYRAAGGFTPWVTYDDGAYLKYMDRGGILPPGLSAIVNGTNQNEFVLNARQLRRLEGGDRSPANYTVNVTQASISDIRAAFSAMELRAATLGRIGRRN
jgi:Lysozyme like domain